MQVFIAEDFGDDKLELKRQIGEFVRRIYRSPRSPDRFVDLTYKIKKTKAEDIEKGKYRIEVKLYHMDVKDSHYNIRQKLWKYKRAVEDDYMNWWDKRKFYGTKPKQTERRIKV